MIKILAFPKTRFSDNPHILNFYQKIEENGEYDIQDLTEFNWVFSKFDIFHLHWPEFFVVKGPFKCFFRVVFFIFLILILSFRGTKMIWTVHNLYPHKHKNVRPKIYIFMLKLISVSFSHLVFLSETSKKIFFKEFQFFDKFDCSVIPHALYDNYQITKHHTPDDLIKKYSLSNRAKTILFFGKIERYKNIEGLIVQFKDISADYNLLIVGSSDDLVYVDNLIKLSGSDSRIKIINEFVVKEDIGAWFSLCDLVCLPFNEILNSGSVMLSLSLAKPVLVPNKGNMKEIQNDVGKNSIFIYDELTSKAILQALKNAKPPTQKNLNKFEILNIANLYKSTFSLVFKKGEVS